jgi:predicted HAD superfamily Cof-like phosphohydrolase
MQEQLKAVEKFHNAFNQENGTIPRLLTDKESQLRYNLMNEENQEYIEACREDNLVEIADALGDQLYILCGTILKHGLQHKIEEVFAEIQRSNMSKLGEDGKPVFREDGKILKGPNYTPPQIAPILGL